MTPEPIRNDLGVRTRGALGFELQGRPWRRHSWHNEVLKEFDRPSAVGQFDPSRGQGVGATVYPMPVQGAVWPH